MMRKPAGRLFSLALALMLLLLPMAVRAATGAQDGIETTLTTDKAAYAAGEGIVATATVRNTNPASVSNVRVELLLPAGLTLLGGNTSAAAVSLPAGGSLSVSLRAASPGGGTAAVPPTGDGSPLGPLSLLACLAGGALAWVIRRERRNAARFFALLLCLLLALAALPTGVLAAIVTRTFSVSESVTAGGASYALTARTTYDWDDTPPPPPPSTYAVTVTDDGLGTATASPNPAAAGQLVTLTAVPADPARHQLRQWTVGSGGAVLSSATANPVTFVMPDGPVSLHAAFGPTPALAAANAEAAKLTGFGADSAAANTPTTLVFPAQPGGFAPGVSFQLTASSPNLGAAMDPATGDLTLHTAAVVDAAALSGVTVTFTATLSGVTSDPVTLSIGSLFAADTTADKLRAAKAALTGPLDTIHLSSALLPINFRLYQNSVEVRLPSGVALQPTTTDQVGITLFVQSSDPTLPLLLVLTMPTVLPVTLPFQNVSFSCAGTRYVIPFVFVPCD